MDTLVFNKNIIQINSMLLINFIRNNKIYSLIEIILNSNSNIDNIKLNDNDIISFNLNNILIIENYKVKFITQDKLLNKYIIYGEELK